MMVRLIAVTLFAVIVFLIAGIALLPMRMVLAAARLDQAGLAAAEVTGTIWHGALRGAQFRGTDLGDVRLGLSPLSLLQLAPQIRFAAPGDGGVQSASASGAMRLLISPGVDKLNAALPLGIWQSSIPLQGQLRFADVSFRFERGRCIGAAGRVSTDALSAGSLGLQGPVLEGPVTCDGSFVLASLAGEQNGMRVRVKLRIDAGAHVKLDSEISGMDAVGEAALSAAGFTLGPNGWARSDQGHL